MLNLPHRNKKPRCQGITAVTDVGTPLQQLQDILTSYADFLDIAKLGIGSAYLEPLLQEKIEIYRAHAVEVYFGGTLFEKFYSQNRLDNYFAYLRDLQIESLEISTGTVTISLQQRCDILKKALDLGFNKVYVEIGSKDNEQIMAPYEWVEEMGQLLEHGCHMLITEGRDSATAGIYRPNGEMRQGLVKEIVSNIDIKHIIFEAPTTATQMKFINMVGANVNLGNVALKDLLVLESQRCGLRYETFNIQ